MANINKLYQALSNVQKKTRDIRSSSRFIRMKNNLKTIIINMIPVILGILIALLINNWKENLQDKRFIMNVMASISMELSENKTELEKTIREHHLFIDTITKYLGSESVSLGELISKSNGFRVTNIRNASWKSFVNTNIHLVDYRYISLLTSIDESKQNMRAQMDKLSDFIYQNLFADDVKQKYLLMLMVNDLLSTEQDLLNAHIDYLSLQNQGRRPQPMKELPSG